MIQIQQRILKAFYFKQLLSVIGKRAPLLYANVYNQENLTENAQEINTVTLQSNVHKLFCIY